MSKVKANRVAVYVFRTSRGGVEFLQLHRSASTGPYAGTWQTVYGGIERRETAIAAAQRELKEETGLTPVAMHLVEFLEGFYDRRRDRVTLLPVFAVRVNHSAKIKLDREHDAHRWVPANQVETQFVWREQRQVIQIIIQDIIGGSPARELLKIPVE